MDLKMPRRTLLLLFALLGAISVVVNCASDSQMHSHHSSNHSSITDVVTNNPVFVDNSNASDEAGHGNDHSAHELDHSGGDHSAHKLDHSGGDHSAHEHVASHSVHTTVSPHAVYTESDKTGHDMHAHHGHHEMMDHGEEMMMRDQAANVPLDNELSKSEVDAVKQHEGHDHGDHDHGGDDHKGHKHNETDGDDMHMNHSMHGMKMWFHTGVHETVLFKEWEVTNVQGMMASAVGIVLMAMFYEGLKYFREYLFKQYVSSMQFSTVAVTGESGRVTEIHKVESHRMLSWSHGLQTCLHVVQIVISYFLMLIFMTYNVWLCLAVVLGSGAGYFVFGWKKATVVDITEHCH